MKTNIHGFEVFAGNIFGENAIRCCSVGLNGRERLFVAYFFQGMSGRNSLVAVDEQGSKFGFYSRGNDSLNDLDNRHDGAVFWWSGGIAGHGKISTRATPSF